MTLEQIASASSLCKKHYEDMNSKNYLWKHLFSFVLHVTMPLDDKILSHSYLQKKSQEPWMYTFLKFDAQWQIKILQLLIIRWTEETFVFLNSKVNVSTALSFRWHDSLYLYISHAHEYAVLLGNLYIMNLYT